MERVNLLTVLYVHLPVICVNLLKTVLPLVIQGVKVATVVTLVLTALVEVTVHLLKVVVQAPAMALIPAPTLALLVIPVVSRGLLVIMLLLV